ncbi:hypothetical protein GUITHDRAFT_82190 [Guillardia theta CCMP2712]|uniref:Cyclin n=1 Tax=Guillardia theta (strain CCMP2712) TaxID=905079 RepID=L1I8F4_GUITC|nr:hypothetical protein GUITHDRAFT_82190 [Guillardia theta CCMP2712]EKX32551.1 hypothetical protein GUITHDRAFT_82190 [Guillardia theta CCMP2712]|eukprot:XP_005819531.1 hypothetical protein GUITHDRAFT_82190 [Guillardia theta CCMP2712]
MKKDAARQEPLVAVIAHMLEETVVRNEQLQKKSSLPSFTGRRPPLTASAFVNRVAKYSGASPCCFAVGLIYLERMKKRDPGVCLTTTNFQRLFLVAVMTAAKFLDDFYYSNKHWAEVGGMTTVEINKLELEFLFRMGFSLHMQREEYDWYAEELHSRAQQEILTAQVQLATIQPVIQQYTVQPQLVQPQLMHVVQFQAMADHRLHVQQEQHVVVDQAVSVPAKLGLPFKTRPSPRRGPEDAYTGPDSFLSAHTTPSSSTAYIPHLPPTQNVVQGPGAEAQAKSGMSGKQEGDEGKGPNGMDWVYC